MKRIIISSILIVISFMLCSCTSKPISYDVNSISSFDEIITNDKAVRYDLRDPRVCEEGHIPNFMCMRKKAEDGTLNSLDELASNIRMIYNKDKIIVLVSEDGEDARILATKLYSMGYDNIHYFSLGYEDYKEAKGDTFIPEVGCNC